MKKIILLDLYDTVLKLKDFRFTRRIEWLYQTYFSDACTYEELLAYSKTFSPRYRERTQTNREVCLVRDELPLYFERFSVRMPEDVEEMDYAILNEMRDTELLKETEETLRELFRRGIRLYILSNGISLSVSTRRLLDRFGIGECFSGVYSSADFGWRKPDRRFFEMAVEKILEDNPGCGRGDILYMGNDYRTDVSGGTGAGLQTVWYNVEHAPNDKGFDCLVIDDFRSLLGIACGEDARGNGGFGN